MIGALDDAALGFKYNKSSTIISALEVDVEIGSSRRSHPVLNWWHLAKGSCRLVELLLTNSHMRLNDNWALSGEKSLLERTAK